MLLTRNNKVLPKRIWDLVNLVKVEDGKLFGRSSMVLSRHKRQLQFIKNVARQNTHPWLAFAKCYPIQYIKNVKLFFYGKICW